MRGGRKTTPSPPGRKKKVPVEAEVGVGAEVVGAEEMTGDGEQGGEGGGVPSMNLEDVVVGDADELPVGDASGGLGEGGDVPS